ncbi:GNAT family N-acetyltransferase [Thiolinea disciformis]|uniref:GNAT family N-acetyltransferase n=1 Tax=Thiolinea disciformis TaxID=125614 RepID=UPI000360A3D1|nr:GNAT family N-acetyltransferase [Thiolinea disciformis]
MALAGHYETVFRLGEQGERVFRDFVEQCINDAAHHAVMVAELEDQIAGYGIVVVESANPYFQARQYAYITDLDIHATFRRQGIGEQLLAALKAWCIDKSIQRIEVSVSTQNPLASHFWQKSGFATYYETKYLML